MQPRVSQLLGELGLSTSRLVMPTRDNLAKFATLVDAAQQLIELKKAVDKQEQDIRTSKARLAAMRGESVEDVWEKLKKDVFYTSGEVVSLSALTYPLHIRY